MFANPAPDLIRDLLRTAKSIAVVGFSPKEDRPSFRVARAMQQLGYRVVPVRPMLAEGLGEKAYANLRELPEVPDIVDVFRAADAAGETIDEAIAIGAKCVWLQEGVINEQAAARAQAAGLTVVMDRCIWKEHRALLP